MCDGCASESTGISRRRLLAGMGAAGLGAVAFSALGTIPASAAGSKDGAWCNPAQGYFPKGGHFGADRGGVPHAGQDVTNDIGTAVYAAAGGTVYAIGSGILGGRTGNGIILFHGGSSYTYYGHLNAFHVSKGASVSAGNLIGDMGATGNVTGPHLHFETHAGGLGSVVNPVDFLASRGVDLKGGWSTLDPGASGVTVSVIQTLLRHRGHSVTVDGDYGSESVDAVEAFQSDAGLVVDGQVGPKTWPKLVATATEGADAELAKAVQRGLNKHSVGLEVDGDFGSVTLAALKNFQKHNQLVVDGECGPVTWKVVVG